MTLKDDWQTGDVFTAADANAVADAVNLLVTAESFGAVGDGSTDDTAALQAWLDAVAVDGGYGTLSSGKNYKIIDALTASTDATDWTIDGSGATITQFTSNTAVFSLDADTEISGFAMRNVVFDYNSQQTSGSGVAAVALGGSGSNGWFDCIFEQLTFNGNCYRGIETNETDGTVVWGSTFSHVWSLYGTTGTVIRTIPGPGCPNNRYEFIYQHRTACAEPTMYLVNQHAVTISNFEVNNADLGGPDLYCHYCYGLTMQNIRSESGTYGSGEGVWELEWCQAVDVSNWEVSKGDFTATAYVFLIEGSSFANIGPGHINTYSPVAAPGSELHVVSIDSSSFLTGYNGVVRPAAVVDGAYVSQGVTTFIDWANNSADTLVSLNPNGVATAAAEVTVGNTTTETALVSKALNSMAWDTAPGTTFRFTIRGTIQVKATSGTLTFTTYIGPTASTETLQMPSQSSAEGPVAFHLVVDATVRSIGSSGTYISNGFGRIELATPVILSTTTTTTAALDTSDYTPATVKLTAAWATADAANVVKVETATIERLM